MRRLYLVAALPLLLGAAIKTGQPSPTSNVSQNQVTATGSTTARTLAARAADVVNVKDYGAKGDGATNDLAFFTDALTSGRKLVVAPNGTYELGVGPLVIPPGVELRGSGEETVLHFTAAPVGVQIGDGATLPSGATVRDLVIDGTGTSALNVDHMWDMILDRIKVDGTWTNGFVFNWTWASTFSNLSTAPATISNACFLVKSAFNANHASNWYTSNFSTYNFLFDSTLGTSSSDSHGNAYSAITAQGGEYGLYVRSGRESSLSGFYSENVVHPIVLGDWAGGALALGWSMSGLTLGGPEDDHPQYANRVALIDLSNVKGLSLRGVNFNGSYNVAETAKVTIGGDGTGATAVSRVTAGGVVHSLELLSGGSGYTTATVSFSGLGSGATATATVADGEVTSLTLTNGGTGYAPPVSSPVLVPAAIRYDRAYHATVEGFWFNSNGLSAGAVTPLYPYVVRATGAASDAGVQILGDASRTTAQGNAANLSKTQGAAYKHALEEVDVNGQTLATLYVPPEFPAAPGAGSSRSVLRRRTFASLTWDAPNVAVGASASQTVAVPGAKVGDAVEVGPVLALPAGVIVSGSVTATQTVTVTVANLSAAPVDLPNAIYRVVVVRQ